MVLYSIIISAYNAGEFLIECLDSIRNQTYTRWEVILVDDGSDDLETARICDKYAMLDERIYVYHQYNKGSVFARAVGINNAKGEYLLFVDADDKLYENTLHDINAIVETVSPDVIQFRARMDGARLHKYSPKLFKDKTIIYADDKNRKKLIKDILTTSKWNNIAFKAVKVGLINIDGRMYSEIRFGTDRIYSMPILFSARKIYYLDKVLYFYRYNPTSIIRSSMNRVRLELHYDNWCRWHHIEKEFLKKYLLYNRENLQRCLQNSFRRKINLAINCLKSTHTESEKKEFVYKIFHDDIMQEISNHMKKTNWQNFFYYWLFQHGLLEQFLFKRYAG